MHIFAKLALVNACLVGLAVGQDLTTGLVGRYPLDGTGQDLSSQNNPLLMYNVQPATDRSGNTAGAVYLNGSTSWMVSTADSAISGSMPRTISAWIKSDDFGFYKGNPMVIGLGDKSSTATLFDLSLQSPGPSNNGWSGVRTAGVFLHGSWMNADTSSRGVVTSVTWAHLVVSTDGSLGGVRIYVNGVNQPLLLAFADASQRFSTVKTKMRISTGSAAGGPSNESYIWWNQGFKGSMDDIRIYSRQLSDSEVAALYQQSSTANSASTISTQPSGQSLLVGQSFQLNVTASGSSPLSYQWLKSGAVIAGATASSYSVASASTADTGAYTVTISNSFGSATSSPATVTVTTPTPPTISTQPSGQSLLVGRSFQLNVTASGSSPLAYQWQKSGAVIAGATASSWSVASASTTDTGAYTVTV